MPVFQKKKNTSMVHSTRVTNSRNKDNKGLTVPRNRGQNNGKKNLNQDQKSNFTTGKNSKDYR